MPNPNLELQLDIRKSSESQEKLLAVRLIEVGMNHGNGMAPHRVCIAMATLPLSELKAALEQSQEPCQHKWKQAGFTGPYWAYECEVCGEEDYRR